MSEHWHKGNCNNPFRYESLDALCMDETTSCDTAALATQRTHGLQKACAHYSHRFTPEWMYEEN